MKRRLLFLAVSVVLSVLELVIASRAANAGTRPRRTQRDVEDAADGMSSQDPPPILARRRVRGINKALARCGEPPLGTGREASVAAAAFASADETAALGILSGFFAAVGGFQAIYAIAGAPVWISAGGAVLVVALAMAIAFTRVGSSHLGV